MKRVLCWSATSVLLSTAGFAQVQPGDILLNVLGGGGASSIHHYQPNGTQMVATTGGTGDVFEGAALTASGLLLTSRRAANGFNLFDPGTGLEVATHDTPTITFVPADVDVFSDGTLAIGDQDGDVELYTEAGVHVLTITNAGITRTFGIHVDANDELWVGDIPTVGSNGGNVFHFTQGGALLGQFATNFEIGDLVVAPDGTIWLADRNNGDVYHLSSTGTSLGSFTTLVQIPEFDGIALAVDGTLYVTSGASSQIYHYDDEGNLLGQFPIVNSNGLALFLRIPGGAIGTKYCAANSNSTGAPADLAASGSASSAAGDFVLTSLPVPNQPGIFFHAMNQAQNPFGCSFLCATGNIVRGAVVGGVGNVASYAYDNSDAKHSLAGFVASTRNFQHWYCDPMGAGGCASGDTFNTSNAFSIPILP